MPLQRCTHQRHVNLRMRDHARAATVHVYAAEAYEPDERSSMKHFTTMRSSRQRIHRTHRGVNRSTPRNKPHLIMMLPMGINAGAAFKRSVFNVLHEYHRYAWRRSAPYERTHTSNTRQEHDFISIP